MDENTTSFGGDAVSYTKRSTTCGGLRESDTGTRVRLCGWVQFRRMGGRFLVLRDWHGIVQLVVSEEQESLLDAASNLNFESVIEVEGTVKLRDDGQQNPKMATGMIEVTVEGMTVLNKAVPNLPFPVGTVHEAREALRMEYRYLDIRNSRMQRNLRRRSKFIMKMREFLANKHDFVDVETPTLFRRTPGGAKEFVVPTREPGHFYSLPQSPQQFKQLLMVGGIDRYFQFARCYRDEGSRPDRQPEFTQLDLEMSFVDREGVISLVEGLLQYSWPEDQGQITAPFPRLTYEQAMRLYGSDKPDTRFDMKLKDVTDICKVCGFPKIEETLGEEDTSAVILHFPQLQSYLPKSGVTKILEEVRKASGEKHQPFVFPIRVGKDNVWPSSISKQMTEDSRLSLMSTTRAEPGDTIFLAVGEKFTPHEFLGRVRLKCAETLKPKGKNLQDSGTYNFLWVVDFPMFMEKEEGEGLESAHHPFTDVHPDDRHMLYTHPHKVRSQHYDLVLNGNEVGGGSIRIHNPDDQLFVLEEVLKEDAGELRHLLEAFTTGCPPHGGIALGMDRLIAILCGAQSIRDVIAFPKTVGGRDLMSKAPAEISDAEKDLYHIQVADHRDSRDKEAIKS